MLGKIATLYSYARTPRVTFFVKHPRKAMVARGMMNSVKRNSQRAALGLGAAAVAVPLGMWIGRKAGQR